MNEDRPDSDSPELPLTETMPSTAGDASQSIEGCQIGPYRLVQKLGEGGMGEVWIAEQEQPIKRAVALKLIKPGLDTKQVIARFEAERQALAMMDHQAVAKVFEAGATPQGRPYFVMEYVRGVPITDYCDRNRLSNHERLELFIQVCEGVQHTHQKAIIHRDLKPSNVLVCEQDGKPFPKIIDFGVAKATAQKLTEKTVFTELGVLIGTPEYMSPEQAELNGENLDTRTDVYSLGVILYELLVGVLPFDSKELRRAGYDGIRKMIMEEEPQKPSTRLSTLGDRSTHSAKFRGVDLRSLQRQLTGDLDWITMKTLEKDRSRRYGSPIGLAADIGRYLAGRPVLASPPSASYRARKYISRHRFGVLAAAVSIVGLIGFAVTMAVQASRIAAERDRVKQVNADMKLVIDFQAGMVSEMEAESVGRRLLEDIEKRVGDASRSRGLSESEAGVVMASFGASVRDVNPTNVALRLIDEEILARAADTLEARFVEQPLIDAQLRGTIGRTYRLLGLFQEAEPQLQRSLEIHQRHLGDRDKETILSMGDMASLYLGQGRHAEAESIHLETIELKKLVFGEEHPSTLTTMSNLAILYYSQGRLAEAESLCVETLEAKEHHLGGDDPETLKSKYNLGLLYWRMGRYAEAEPLFLATYETKKRVIGATHPDTLHAMLGLATLYEVQGRTAEAESLFLEALAAQKRVLGDEHPETLRSMNNLAIVYYRQDRPVEAEALYLETLEIRTRKLGGDHLETLGTMSNLALLYQDQSRYAEAESLSIETLNTRKRVFGVQHPDTLVSMNNLAKLYYQQDRYAKAETIYLETLEIQKRILGDKHPATLGSMYNLAVLYQDLGRYAEAEPFAGEAFEVRKRVLGDDHRDTLASMNQLALLYASQSRHSEAESLYLETLEINKREFGPTDPKTLDALYNLACLAATGGERSTAFDWLEQAVEGGLDAADLMTQDSDLVSLHGVEFDALVQRARNNAMVPTAKQ